MRWRNTSSVGEMLDELEWPSLEARRDQFSVLIFHKIHCGAVSIEKDKCMTPAHSLKTTRQGWAAIPPPVFTGGIYRYFPAWQIRLKWEILGNTGKYNFFTAKYWQI